MTGASLALTNHEFRCSVCEYPIKIYKHPIIKTDRSKQIFFVQLCNDCIETFKIKGFTEGYEEGRADMLDEHVEEENQLHDEHVEELKQDYEHTIEELKERINDYINVITLLRSNGHRELVEKACEKHCIPCFP